jgi:hypothetical protein
MLVFKQLFTFLKACCSIAIDMLFCYICGWPNNHSVVISILYFVVIYTFVEFYALVKFILCRNLQCSVIKIVFIYVVDSFINWHNVSFVVKKLSLMLDVLKALFQTSTSNCKLRLQNVLVNSFLGKI